MVAAAARWLKANCAMTPAARAQAAIDILDEVIASARGNGPPADVIVQRYFKTRRYAGSKDRRAVRELAYRAIRRSAEVPVSGRAALLGLASDEAELYGCFDGSPHGPEIPLGCEERAGPSLVPEWVVSELSPLVGPGERPALLERAPLDLRVNAARIGREALLGDFPDAVPTRLSPLGLRLPADTRIDDSAAYRDGLVEVQDEGSQLIALACRPAAGELTIDLCAGAGGKSLALAAIAPGARILAADTNRARLSMLAPRAVRAGAAIETRLLDAGREQAMLGDLAGSADLVLVDAPCSGSGTWRRNPEGRWRLTRDRLDHLVELQRFLLDLAAPLVRPGGALVYATCSILAREGAGQAADFLGRHSSWSVQDVGFDGGRVDGTGRLLTPGHDGTDGFFVARLQAPC